MLDPVADRLAIAAGLIALAVRGVFPVWAAVLILVRDVAVLVVGRLRCWRAGASGIDVRWIGKVATFSLMVAVPAIAWGALDLPARRPRRPPSGGSRSRSGSWSTTSRRACTHGTSAARARVA